MIKSTPPVTYRTVPLSSNKPIMEFNKTNNEPTIYLSSEKNDNNDNDRIINEAGIKNKEELEHFKATRIKAANIRKGIISNEPPQKSYPPPPRLFSDEELKQIEQDKIEQKEIDDKQQVQFQEFLKQKQQNQNNQVYQLSQQQINKPLVPLPLFNNRPWHNPDSNDDDCDDQVFQSMQQPKHIQHEHHHTSKQLERSRSKLRDVMIKIIKNDDGETLKNKAYNGFVLKLFEFDDINDSDDSDSDDDEC